MRISDWSSDVCSSDLTHRARRKGDQRRFDGRYRSAGEGDLSMFDLTGLTALVPGASGGIGSAIARGLAAKGARVALSSTREDALKEVADGKRDGEGKRETVSVDLGGSSLIKTKTKDNTIN